MYWSLLTMRVEAGEPFNACATQAERVANSNQCRVSFTHSGRVYVVRPGCAIEHICDIDDTVTQPAHSAIYDAHGAMLADALRYRYLRDRATPVRALVIGYDALKGQAPLYGPALDTWIDAQRRNAP